MTFIDSKLKKSNKKHHISMQIESNMLNQLYKVENINQSFKQ